MVGVMRPVLAMLYTDHRLIPAARARAFTDAARRWFRRRFELYLIDLTTLTMSVSLIMGWSPAWGFSAGPTGRRSRDLAGKKVPGRAQISLSFVSCLTEKGNRKGRG